MSFREFIKRHHPLPEIAYKRRKKVLKPFRRGQRVTHRDTPEDVGTVWRVLSDGYIQVHWTSSCGEEHERILDRHRIELIHPVNI